MKAEIVEYPPFEDTPVTPAYALPRSDTIRAYYDPTDRLANMEDGLFIGTVIENRRTGIARGLGQLTAPEVIVVDATQATLTDLDRYEEHLALPPKRQRALTALTSSHADIIASHVVSEVDRTIDSITSQPFFKETDRPLLPSRVLMAGKLLGAVAHQGQLRQSGKEYISHPDAVASIVAIAFRRQFGMSQEDKLDALRFLALTHDAPEDTFRPDSSHLYEKRIIVTPLLALKTLQLLGSEYAHDVSKTLLLMANLKDVYGNQMDYIYEYIVRGVIEQPLLYTIDKLGDNHHNKNIEPKTGPGGQKSQAKYGASMAYLNRKADEYLDFTDSMVAASISSVTKQDIAERQRRRFGFNAEKSAAGLHSAIDLDLGAFALAA